MSDDNSLPPDAENAEISAGADLPDDFSERAENQRLDHEKDSHKREETLFTYARYYIGWLTLFGCIFACIVAIAVFKGASSWLITLASICFLTPALLLICLFQHVYSKDNVDNRAIKQIIDRAPIIELIKNISEWIKDIISKK